MRTHAVTSLFAAAAFALALAAGCDDPAPTQPPVAPTTSTGLATTLATTASPTAAAPATATATATASAQVAPPRPGSPFVRHPPHSTNSDADAVDACTQVGGNYFSCRGAYFDEANPVLKRYLWRIAQGQVAGESGYSHRGPPDTDLPHAEVPFMCDPTKACNATNESGELNHATSCLARAFADQIANKPAAALAAHKHACKCNSKEASFPGYNSTPFICDDRGRPAFIAPKMKADEGADIVLCASCEPKKGPAACKREIERLQKEDAELARHIETRQIPRCQTPNEGPNNWD